MKLRFSKPKLFITASFLLCASTTLHAFTPPDGYQGRLLVPRTLMINPALPVQKFIPLSLIRQRNPDLKAILPSRKDCASVFMNLKSMCVIVSMRFRTIFLALTNASLWRANRIPVA